MENVQIHMIGNAHIDPAWLWPWEDGVAEVLATFRSALDRLRAYPDFIFTCAGSIYYQWVEALDPAMFTEIQAYVSQGRWGLAGGWLLQPDCNLPGGESFARQALYGQLYFYEKFAKISTFGYCVDSFGHNAMLPQLLKKGGMHAYVMMRPQAFERAIPHDVFWWQSPDGSRVLTFRIVNNYASYWGETDPLLDKVQEVAALAARDHVPYMCFYGVGNHGGGPTIKNIESILSLQEETENTGTKVVFSAPDRYFAALRAGGQEYMVWEDDLQHHSSGCYSAHAQTKQLNRLAEERLESAEKFLCLDHFLLGSQTAAGQGKIEEAWKKVLFNQFHDVLCGCSIRQVYEDSNASYGAALTAAAEVQAMALQRIAWNIDTFRGQSFPLSRDKDWLTWEKENLGVPLVLFNPLSWQVNTFITVDKPLKGVATDDGTRVPFQIVRGPRNDLENIWDTVFEAEIPAFGYTVYWLYNTEEKDAAPEKPVEVQTDPVCIENEFWKLCFSVSDGGLRCYDKLAACEVFSGPAAVGVVMQEYGTDTWGHSTNYFDQMAGRFSAGTVVLLEHGALRAKVRVTTRYLESVLQQDFILYSGRPEIDVQAKLLWTGKHEMLKLEFPLHTDLRSFYEIPYGYFERPANGEEEPMQRWVAAGATQGYGCALLSSSKYSASAADGKLRLTIVRSPVYAESAGLYLEHTAKRDAHCDFMDQGEHLFSYSILPYHAAGAPCFERLTRLAKEKNTKFPAIKETYHKGRLPRLLEGVSIDAENVALAVVKPAERRAGWTLRLYETAGRPACARVALPLLGRELALTFHRHEIKTLFVPQDAAQEVVETNFLEGVVPETVADCVEVEP